MKILYKLKRLSITGVIVLTFVGCEMAYDAGPHPVPPPGDGWEDDPNTGSPKRPVPIKPKRNPEGKIQRPKLVEDLILQIITQGCMPYDHHNIDEPR